MRVVGPSAANSEAGAVPGGIGAFAKAYRSSTPAERAGRDGTEGVARGVCVVTGSREAAIEQLFADEVALAERIAGLVLLHIDGYRPLDVNVVMAAGALLLHSILSALRDQRRLSARERAILRAHGESRARQGVTLDDIHSASRLTTRELVDQVVAACDDDGLAIGLVQEMLDLVDEATLAYSCGHRDAERAGARGDDQRRGAYVRGLLSGGLDPGDIRLGAERYGLDVEARYVAFRADAAGGAAVDQLESALRRDSRVHRVLVTELDGDLVGVLSRAPRVQVEFAIGFGPLERLSDLERSYRLATRVMTTARCLQLTGGHDLDTLGLSVAVTADPDIGEHFRHRFVDPLGQGESARVIVDTVWRYIEVGMRIDVTAEALVVHPNTVRYRIARFEELTGVDLRKPHCAFQVWWAIQYAHILASPAAVV